MSRALRRIFEGFVHQLVTLEMSPFSNQYDFGFVNFLDVAGPVDKFKTSYAEFLNKYSATQL